MLSDSNPILTNAQSEAIVTENLQPVVAQDPKEEPDPELAIPKSSVPNYQTSVVKQAAKSTETKKSYYRKGNFLLMFILFFIDNIKSCQSNLAWRFKR